jgi:hypothetical protein
MPNGWEVAHGLNPGNPADATLDSDGDGTSNLEEYLAGTDPFVFDGLRILAARFDQSGMFSLTVHAAVGMTYIVEASTNLIQWSPLTTFLCQGANQEVRVPTSGLPACFYRLKTTTNAPVPLLNLLNRPNPPAVPPLIQILAPPGYHYSLQVSTNLKDWTELTNFYGTASHSLITDYNATRGGSRFYRVMDR